MRFLAFILVGGMSVAAAAAAQGSGARLDGVYLSWRTTTPVGLPEQSYLTFSPDGRVYEDDPDEGLAPPTDWARTCRTTRCGTYRVAGGEVAIRWSSGAEQRYEMEAGGVLKPRGSARRLRPLARLDGLRLEGVYVRHAAAGDVVVGITFSRGGEFREYNLLPHTNWVMRGDPAQRQRVVVGEGWGRYTIRRNTLELRYSNGLVARLMIFVPPGAPAQGDPPTIYINRTSLTRSP